MSDDDIPTSGSRWEPSAEADARPGHARAEPAGGTAEPTGSIAEPTGSIAEPTASAVPSGYVVGTAEHGTLPSDDVASRSTTRRPGRAALAAAGVGLVLAGGIGGFAIGHAAAGSAGGTGTVSDQNGLPGRDGFGSRPDSGNGQRPDGLHPGGSDPDRTGPDGTVPDGPDPDGTTRGGTDQGVAPPNTGGGTA